MNEKSKELLFRALGAASMCWKPLPSNQVFNSTRCKEIGDRLAEQLDNNIESCSSCKHNNTLYVNCPYCKTLYAKLPSYYKES